jgi:hypothetical protein
MLDLGEIVTYKDFEYQLFGQCGIVEGIVQDEPDCVWVRWVGETTRKKEHVADLEII